MYSFLGALLHSAEGLASFFVGLVANHPYILYFSVFGLSIPEGPVLTVVCAFLVSRGLLNPLVVYPLVVLGDVIGDSFWYYVGRRGAGVRIPFFGPFFGVTKKNIERARTYFSAHSIKLLLASKLIYGPGLAGLVLAGATRFDYRRYVAVCFCISAAQSVVLMTLGFQAGDAYTRVIHYINIYVAASCLVVAAVGIFLGLRYLLTKVLPACWQTNRTKLCGVYHFLARWPLFIVVVVLFMGSIGAIIIGRDVFEGLGYMESWSALVGDALLLAAVLNVRELLQRPDIHLPAIFQNGASQLLLAVVCVGIGIEISYFTLSSRSGQLMDIYHDTIIAPAILCFAVTLLPVLWINRSIARGSINYTVIAVLVWGVLVAIDVSVNRMNQRQFLEQHPVGWLIGPWQVQYR